MTSLTAVCPPRESHLMDEDRAPRRHEHTAPAAPEGPAPEVEQRPVGRRRPRMTIRVYRVGMDGSVLVSETSSSRGPAWEVR